MADAGDFRLALDQAADEAGKSTRRYTTAINSAGIAATLAIGGKLIDLSVHPVHELWVPFFFFVLGLLLTGASTMLAKHKRVSDRDRAYAERKMDNWDRFLFRNWSYEIASIGCFAIGVVWEIAILWNLGLAVC